MIKERVHLHCAGCLVSIALCLVAEAASFRNLGFEEARTNITVLEQTVPGIVSGRGPISDLLPGWDLSAFVPGVRTNSFAGLDIGFNAGIGFGGVSLYDTNARLI